jgi:hypothetical protein
VLRRGGIEVGAAFRPSRKIQGKKEAFVFSVSFDILCVVWPFHRLRAGFCFLFFIIIGRVIHVLLAVASGQTRRRAPQLFH